MDVYEALYTTRMMRRMRPDPISIESQCRILDAAIRAPNGGNTQRWHFVVVDDAAVKERVQALYRSAREQEWADMASGHVGVSADDGTPRRERALRRLKRSGDAFTEHLADVPLLVFVF